MSVYLDHAATTPMFDVAIEAMNASLRKLGNPSSLHTEGRSTRKDVEDAREKLAKAIDCLPSEVIFTGSGTEANNAAIKGLYWHSGKKVVVVSGIEHHAVLDPAHWLVEHEGAELIELPVSSAGVIDLDFLKKLVAERGTEIALISVMHSNNETGVIQPVGEIAKIAGDIVQKLIDIFREENLAGNRIDDHTYRHAGFDQCKFALGNIHHRFEILRIYDTEYRSVEGHQIALLHHALCNDAGYWGRDIGIGKLQPCQIKAGLGRFQIEADLVMGLGGNQVLLTQFLGTCIVVAQFVDRCLGALDFQLGACRIDTGQHLTLPYGITLFGQLGHHDPGALGNHLRLVRRLQIGGAGITGIDTLAGCSDHLDRNRFRLFGLTVFAVLALFRTGFDPCRFGIVRLSAASRQHHGKDQQQGRGFNVFGGRMHGLSGYRNRGD